MRHITVASVQLRAGDYVECDDGCAVRVNSVSVNGPVVTCSIGSRVRAHLVTYCMSDRVSIRRLKGRRRATI